MSDCDFVQLQALHPQASIMLFFVGSPSTEGCLQEHFTVNMRNACVEWGCDNFVSTVTHGQGKPQCWALGLLYAAVAERQVYPGNYIAAYSASLEKPIVILGLFIVPFAGNFKGELLSLKLSDVSEYHGRELYCRKKTKHILHRVLQLFSSLGTI